MRALLLIAITLAVALLLAGCDGGSKDFKQDFYKIDFETRQDVDGSIIIEGKTDLPDGSQVDAVVTTINDVARFTGGAVLNGSTRSPGSVPVKRAPGHSDELAPFTVKVAQPLTETCKRQAPCGPFPAGRYWVVVDAKTPHQDSAGITTYQDDRYQSVTHGYEGFPGIEIVKELKLAAIQLQIDKAGHIGNGEPASPAPGTSPAPRATP